MSFGALGLCDELLKAVAKLGYSQPSPIQTAAIPAALKQQDIMAIASTGTGKTAGFTLPVVQLLAGGVQPQPKHVRALILTPTRELAAQVAESVKNYSQYMNLSAAAVFGGVRIEPQKAQLQEGADVLVATPGRLIDLYNQQAVSFDQLEILVLDEADRMLALGFSDEMSHIQTLLPSKRQTLLFSATFSKPIKSLGKGMLSNPQLIEVANEQSTIDNIKQTLHPVDKARKSELLIHLIRKNKWRQILVFSRTKVGADVLVTQLEKARISAASIHANRTQHARTQVLEGFKSGSIKVLVATDIASRGIDVNQLPCVVNFDLPYEAEDYIHRIGRTGRAGNSGLAISLFSEEEAKRLHAIETLIGRKLAGEIVKGFAPKPKAIAHSADDEYGNFEPDPEPQGKGKGRGGRSGKSSNKKGNKRR
ncbi:DEAD/DEAH box helicase [Agarivorans sp. 1_MG-2023]|uniref:DEAD/DEAH box helicase n=1 Tax=Agarivorans sp. 1_MG-2023 TaxID=3062634 RepID=UPI0026E2FA92|nr:DEAD/DEAH box helicase [Agarivorans sp. 1_MG-2023]MDO6762953.1 DEAD/DEAH box helicase [Agarivorans sp. 1_MG-2023]